MIVVTLPDPTTLRIEETAAGVRFVLPTRRDCSLFGGPHRGAAWVTAAVVGCDIFFSVAFAGTVLPSAVSQMPERCAGLPLYFQTIYVAALACLVLLLLLFLWAGWVCFLPLLPRRVELLITPIAVVQTRFAGWFRYSRRVPVTRIRGLLISHGRRIGPPPATNPPAALRAYDGAFVSNICLIDGYTHSLVRQVAIDMAKQLKVPEPADRVDLAYLDRNQVEPSPGTVATLEHTPKGICITMPPSPAIRSSVSLRVSILGLLACPVALGLLLLTPSGTMDRESLGAILGGFALVIASSIVGLSCHAISKNAHATLVANSEALEIRARQFPLSQNQRWDRQEVVAVRLMFKRDADRLAMELVHPKGPPTELLLPPYVLHDDHTAMWIATLLRQALGVPEAAFALPSQPI